MCKIIEIDHVKVTSNGSMFIEKADFFKRKIVKEILKKLLEHEFAEEKNSIVKH
jgi:hemerythrin superfamily protein